MKVLIVKTSSMGDVIHTLPALTDAAQHFPQIRFDWVTEEAFAEIPAWHSHVDRVIPMAWRRWRKHPFATWKQKEFRDFRQNLMAQSYDYVIDAQGLLKSAIIARMSHGLRCGLDFSSARETLASLFYQRRCKVIFEQHAVIRARQLFASVLGYDVPEQTPNYDIQNHFVQTKPADQSPYVVFIHGTSSPRKQWPESHWIQLAHHCTQAGYQVQIPWGSAEEQQRAERIAKAGENIVVLPKMSLSAMAAVLLNAKAVVAVDTGLGHLAAALSVPTLSLYGPTDPAMIGTCGKFQAHLQVPRAETCASAPRHSANACSLENLPPHIVWGKLCSDFL